MCHLLTTDAWLQFGVCLWEIVTSQIPKRNHMYHPTKEECPPEVGRLIEDCMRRNPRDRPSAREIYRLARTLLMFPPAANSTLTMSVRMYYRCALAAHTLRID